MTEEETRKSNVTTYVSGMELVTIATVAVT